MKLLRLLCLWPVAAIAAVDLNNAWAPTVAALTLAPASSAETGRDGADTAGQVAAPQPGDVKLGYTFFQAGEAPKWHPNAPGRSGWFRLVESGEVEVWCDQDGDKQPQPEEVMIVSSRLWFAHRAQVATVTGAELPAAGGGDGTEAVPELGDRAWFVAEGRGEAAWLGLMVVRGGVAMRFEGQPVLTVCAGPEFDDDPILRSVAGGALCGDLRAYAIRPDSVNGFLDVAARAPRVEQLLRGELVAMARKVLREWDRRETETAGRAGPTVAQGPAGF